MTQFRILENYGNKAVRIKTDFYLNIPICKRAVLKKDVLYIEPEFLKEKETAQKAEYKLFKAWQKEKKEGNTGLTFEDWKHSKQKRPEPLKLPVKKQDVDRRASNVGAYKIHRPKEKNLKTVKKIDVMSLLNKAKQKAKEEL